jgi:hypothetical protein
MSFWDSLVSFGNTAKDVAQTAAPYVGAATQLYGYNQARDAAQQNAAALTNLGNTAAAAAEFRPYAVTTGFGSGFFDTGAGTAGYELSPIYQAFRDRTLGTSAGVYDQLGAADPQQMAAQYLAEQQGLLTPQRTAEDIALRNAQLNRGRIGLGLSSEAAGAGMGGMVNPEQFSLQRARALADAQMSAGAREQAQADIDRLISRAGGLFQTGSGIEQLGMGALEAGANLGGRASTAGANMASNLLAAGQGAASANLAAGLAGAQGAQQLGAAFSGLFGNRR